MPDIDTIRKLAKLMIDTSPGDHFHALGMRFVRIEKAKVTGELPYSAEIVGNPETGVIHGGALTALLDTCSGFAAVAALDELALCPTMDLRIDYMRPAEPNKSVFAVAEAYRVTRQVVFCRGVAYQDDIDNPVAHCVANFTRLDPSVNAEMAKMIEPFLADIELDT
jgi:uncharacterized protein (TIGR00369 family)